MTREEALKLLADARYADDLQGNDDLQTAHIMAMEALRQEPCEDCISRQAVEKITWEEPNYTDTLNVLTEVRDKVRALPSVTPQPKTGHWEYVQYDGNPNIGNWHCSECNRIVSGAISAVNPVYVYKYCPNCGAKMAESEEEQ